ncbi:hypothetical protein L6R52_25665 [Myxococcota bacterium]|nr:hypothetical protein [Myxococcota bacterium]
MALGLRSIFVVVAFALIGALAPSPARADVRLELGGAYWLDQGGVFTADLALTTAVARSIAVGGRVGGVLTTDPTGGGLPIDLLVRFQVVRPLFIEVLGGPWLLFDRGDTVHGHFAIAIGTSAGSVTFAAELGYLDPDPIFGAKIGFRL